MSNRIFRIVFVVLALALAAQAQHNQSSVFTPRTTSATAASNCGITEEQLRSEGYTHKYTFTVDSSATTWIDGCSAGNLFRDTHGHKVAIGTVGMLKGEKSAEIAFPGTCNNRAGLATMVKADEAEADLAPTAPPAQSSFRQFEDRRPGGVPPGVSGGQPAERPDDNYGYRRPQTVAPYVSVLSTVTNVINNNTTNTNITPAPTPSVKPVDNWCNDYRPGWRTLYIGGFAAQQFRCHPGRSIGILLVGAAAVPGIAYATNSLWWAKSATSGGNNNGGNGGNNGGGGNNNPPDTIYGYPKADWEAGPCSLWAVGGKYYGRRPIPARCF